MHIAEIEASSPLVLPPGYVLDFDLTDPDWYTPGQEAEYGAQDGAQVDPNDYSGPATQFALTADELHDFDRLNDPEFDPPVPDDGELSLADENGASFSSEERPDAAPEPDLEHGPLPLLRVSADVAPAEPPAVVFSPPPPPPEPELDEPDFVRLARDKEEAARRRRLTMGAGSALLALVLLAQGVSTFRNVLAAKYPGLTPALSAACVPLRCKIALPAQIEELVLEAGELQTINSTTFQLTTLLRNESGLTQAWPYIELELTDANDKALVRRVFTPAQYLPPGVAAAKGFASRTEQPVKITFELKQLKASGFHIAVFYP